MRFHHAHHAPAAVQSKGAGIAPFIPLYMVIFIAFIGYAMTVTIFVPMLLDTTANFVSKDTSTGTRTVIAGILMALYPSGQFFGSPIVGALSDRFGRKPVLIVSLILSVVLYLVICVGLQLENLWLLMIGCFMVGLSEADVAIAQSTIADRAAPEDRGRYFGFIYAAMSLAYIVGPLGGGWLSQHLSYAAPFWGVLGLLVLTVLGVAAFFHGAPPPAHPGEKINYLKEFTNLRNVFIDHRIRRLYLANFLLFFALFGYYRVVTVVMYDSYGLTKQGPMMSYYAYLAFMAMIANLFVTGLLTKHFKLRPLTIVLLGLSAVGYIATGLPWGPHPLNLLWIFVITGFAPCIAISCAGALLSESVGPAEQGAVMGNNQALQVGAEAISAAALPAIAALGMTTMFGSGLSMYVAAAVMLLALIVLAATHLPAPNATIGDEPAKDPDR